VDIPSLIQELKKLYEENYWECNSPRFLNCDETGHDEGHFDLWHNGGPGGRVAVFDMWDEARLAEAAINSVPILIREIERLRKWEQEQKSLDDILNRPNKHRIIKTERGEYYEH
jgi:hypothetical protein